MELDIYNMLEQKSRHLQNHYVGVGQHQVVWDGHDEEGQRPDAGVFFIVMKVGSFSQIAKVVRM